MTSGQVPHTSRSLPYGILGQGRAARHFRFYLESLGHSVISTHRRWEPRFEDCAAILILIPDREIEPLALDWRTRTQAPLIHASGALQTQAAIGFHPLMTFGLELYPLEKYRRIAFVGDAPESRFREIFPTLPNSYYPIRADQKALYHALCVLGGNFTTFLWSKVFEDFSDRLGIPPEAALPYLDQVHDNLTRHCRDPRQAWTGPLVRGDQETIQKNLGSLQGDPFETVYRAFVQAIGQAIAPGNLPSQENPS